MFQYAAGFALARHTGTRLMLDITHLNEASQLRAYRAGHTVRSFELSAFYISGEIARDCDVRKFLPGPESSLGSEGEGTPISQLLSYALLWSAAVCIRRCVLPPFSLRF